MKYNIDTFIKRYDYNFRRKCKLLKVDKLSLHKRMKEALYYISYFLRYMYDREIPVTYRERVDGMDEDNQHVCWYHNISFFIDNYYCILETGRYRDTGLFMHASVRLYKTEGRGLETLATESLSLDDEMADAYANYIDAAMLKLFKKIFPEEVQAWYVVQGIKLYEVL